MAEANLPSRRVCHRIGMRVEFSGCAKSCRYKMLGQERIEQILLASTIYRSRASYLLTTDKWAVIVIAMGGARVKRVAWILVLVLQAVTICVSAIPQTDLPETSYNEVDTPVNQAPPVVAGLRFARPIVSPSFLPRQVSDALRGIAGQAHERKLLRSPIRRNANSLQDFLSTFLI